MMLIPAVALAANFGIPGTAAATLIMLQDGRMDKFIAAPRITLPVEIIADRPSAATPATASSSSNSVVKTTPAAIDPNSLPGTKEKKLSIHVFSDHTSDLIAQLQQQGIQLIINLSTFPEGGVVIDVDDKPESFVMTTLGEAMGGEFFNRGGIWIWNKQANRPMGFGRMTGEVAAPVEMSFATTEKVGEAVARNATKFVAVAPISGHPKAVTVVVRAGTAQDVLSPLFSLSPIQQKTLKTRGYLRYDELSKFQKSRIPVLAPGQILVLNGIKIKG